jgi:hypothetical protein
MCRELIMVDDFLKKHLKATTSMPRRLKAIQALRNTQSTHKHLKALKCNFHALACTYKYLLTLTNICKLLKASPRAYKCLQVSTSAYYY